jgi:hypothetical protein
MMPSRSRSPLLKAESGTSSSPAAVSANEPRRSSAYTRGKPPALVPLAKDMLPLLPLCLASKSAGGRGVSLSLRLRPGAGDARLTPMGLAGRSNTCAESVAMDEPRRGDGIVDSGTGRGGGRGGCA